MLNLGLAAIVKDEINDLLEWIAYHRVIGVDHFFIADNDSTDGTRELLASLSTAGIVTLIDVHTLPGQRPQLPAYSELLGMARKNCDVLAFIDADEFLMPTDDATTIKPLLEKIFSDPHVSALALNWANFGSAGAVFLEDGLVIDRFVRRAKLDFKVHHHYKTIVRPERGIDFYNPHHVNLNSGRYVNTLGIDLIPHNQHGSGLSDIVVWSGARVNHYATKSLEEFLLGKSRRGSASKEGRIKHKRYFMHHDRNDEECLLATRFSGSTLEQINYLSNLIPPDPKVEARVSQSTLSRLLNWRLNAGEHKSTT
ncbi:glycosyltransferase family 2 protein [Burkholderia sp. Bp9017]|uniref:glycosyltransferase family 92 protein n=1 Tax=Burkholderia TaxID=32008 RepID=UPI000F5E9B5B|nr:MULTISPECIES: glycosyltransferase family 92 protein [Burkholderia]RQZ13144.1 glycosyltransferase family 2 protein [Burkholderia sp. Bp9017]RQZ25604.1 glycosyltransferase family 2 protein [Burkholderia sp. Bp9016]